MNRADDMESDLWKVAVCRSKEGGCRFALSSLLALKEAIESELQDAGWNEFVRSRLEGRVLPHHMLKIGLAACPNACSRPQVQDIGLIAALRPEQVLETCTACGVCERVCREGAIKAEGDIAEIRKEACLACGECITACPVTAIEAEPLYFRVMFGGRLGRHPRWATQLPIKFDLDDVPLLIGRFVRRMISDAEPGERVSEFVERLGLDWVGRRAEG